MGKNNNKNNNNKPSTNQQIQKQLSSAGNTVSYKEAAAVAAKVGVSVDRVYNQTAKTGQDIKAGAAAANAGYTPTSQLKVGNPITSSYVTQYAANQQTRFNEALAAAQASGTNPDGSSAAEPTFDWDAWNAQMMEQQAALWASMDAMNAQFLQQQQAWMESQKAAQQQFTYRGPNFFGSLGSTSDQAQVKRQKARKRSASTTNPALSIGSGGSGSGVSLGGASSGNTLGVG